MWRSLLANPRSPLHWHSERLRVASGFRREALQVKGGQVSLVKKPCRSARNDGDRVGLQDEGTEESMVQLLPSRPSFMVHCPSQVVQVSGVKQGVRNVVLPVPGGWRALGAGPVNLWATSLPVRRARLPRR